ncbi:hypothetical protein NMY22_g6936 [Coprinellus aureogranulatus]|nr:hypothetical protein NMY22_g6936 [Coprinellus aureogranulatus]
MPVTRPGWTVLQRLDLHVAAIVYLRSVERRTCISTFLATWWDYWVEVYGIPDPDDWDQVDSYEDHVSEQRRRVHRAIRAYAMGGQRPPCNSNERMERILRLRLELLEQLARYQAEGHDLSGIRTPPRFEVIFEDTIRDIALLHWPSSSFEILRRFAGNTQAKVSIEFLEIREEHALQGTVASISRAVRDTSLFESPHAVDTASHVRAPSLPPTRSSRAVYSHAWSVKCSLRHRRF